MSFIEGTQNHIIAFVLALIVLTIFSRIYKEKKSSESPLTHGRYQGFSSIFAC
jgi:hypothetical protein